jgi:TolB-like protein/Tfp pilus assembly protein PilF
VTQSSKGVFLSYASEDADVAKRICDALRTASIEVWFDQSELRGGDTWDQKIRQQIRDCALFLPIISEHTQTRPEGYFRLEWKLAVDRSHLMASEKAFLVPVVVDATPEPEALVPAQFREVQWTRIQAGEVQAAFVERIALLLNQPVARHVGSPERGVNRVPTGRLAIVSIALAVAAVIGIVIATAMRGGWLGQGPSPKVDAGMASASLETTSAAIPEKSIAVLPFVDMSEKHDQEYFSDGLTEELIDRIASAPGLKVIARTSSFQFKGKNEDVRSIAQKLNVANLLEGSVRRSGQSLRVTAELIRATDGTHRWSHSYDEQVSNIFKVQEAIAEKVSNELESVLTVGSTAITRTTDLQAYDAVQKGIFLWVRSEAGDEDKALALFQEAARLDPNYALAWAKIGSVYFIKGYFGELSVADARPKALAASRRALAIDPDLAAAHNTLGAIYQNFDWNWRGAKEEFEAATRLDPNGSYQANVGYLTWMLTGDISSEIAALRRDLVRDPLDTGTLWTLGLSYWAAQRYAESAEAFVRLLELNPHYSGAPSLYAQTLVFMGQYERALATVLSDTDKTSTWNVQPCIYWKLGRRAQSDAALAELEKEATKAAYDLARMSACRGETDKVFAWLERAYGERQMGLANVKFDPYFLSLRPDQRFQSLLSRMNLSDEGNRR